MSSDLSGLLVWLGGVLSWLVATLMHWFLRARDFDRERQIVERLRDKHPDYTSEILGDDIDQYIENNNLAERPNGWRSLFTTPSESLLCLTLVSVLDLGVKGHNGSVFLGVFTTLMILLSMGFAIIHNLKSREWSDKSSYRLAVLALWSLAACHAVVAAGSLGNVARDSGPHDSGSQTSAVKNPKEGPQPQGSTP